MMFNMSQRCLILLLALNICLNDPRVNAFSPYRTKGLIFFNFKINQVNFNRKTFRGSIVLQSISENKDDGDDDGKSLDCDKKEGSGLLPLPPIGESSFDPASLGQENNKLGKTSIALDSDEPTKVALVGSAKFELQYTCAVCETKNNHRVSRLGKIFIKSINRFRCKNSNLKLTIFHFIAYTKGVVITVCKGCMSRHLIADNLGWSKDWGIAGFDGKSNIEELMDDQGRGDEVNRVTEEVFNLEKIIDLGADDSQGKASDDMSAFE